MKFGGFEKFTLIDYPGKIACMVYTIGCPFRCPYCHNPELVEETCEVTFDERVVLAFLDTRRGMLDGVVITGGEPSMHGEQLLSFMDAVKRMGFLIKLDTNGVDPEFVRTAAGRGLVDYIAMDVKAPLRKYMQTVGRPVDTKAIRETISEIMRSGIDYEFRTTIVKSMLSPEDIEEIGDELRGAGKYYLQKFIPTKVLNPQFLKKVSYTDEELEGMRQSLLSRVAFCGIR